MPRNIGLRPPALRPSLGMLMLVAICASQPAATRAAEAVAMVTDLVGSASIIEDGQERDCQILSNLASGVEIATTDGAKLSLVYFDSSKEYAVTGMSRLKIGEDGPEVRSGARPSVRDLRILKETGIRPTGNAGYAQAAIVLRSPTRKKKLQLLSPKDTKVLDVHPEFRWKALEQGLQYRFVLIDESGRTVAQALVNEPRFKLPAQVSLEGSVYYTWTVETRLVSGEVYSSSVDFDVGTATERKLLKRLRPAQSAPFSDRLLFAQVLEQMGFREEAREYWKRLAAERPGFRKFRHRERQ